MTLDGAKRTLKHGAAAPSGDELPVKVEILERLQSIRAQLLEVRETLKAEPNEIRIDEPVQRVQPPVAKPVAEGSGAVDSPRRKSAKERAVGHQQQADREAVNVKNDAAAVSSEPVSSADEKPTRAPFYEQTLF